MQLTVRAGKRGIMKKIALLIALALPVFAAEPSYDVKELTKCEQDELAKARADVEKAQAALDAAKAALEGVSGTIKDKYTGYSSRGWSANVTGTFTTGCRSTAKEAEIKGKWVIITTKEYDHCAGGGSFFYNGSVVLTPSK
jgi:hypothetical protein